MPVPNDGVAYTPSDMPILKHSDQATYVEGAAFVERSFAQKVHPFSNSISGTVLAQLRTLAALKSDSTVVYANSAEMMSKYLQLSIATMSYLVGSHSLYEFTAPLSLPEVLEEFKELKGFENISLESLFYTGNENSFTRTLNYNQQTLKQVAMRDELGERAPKNITLESLKPIELNLSIGQILEKVTAAKETYDERIKRQFFSGLRSGARQNILNQEHLSKIQTFLLEKNIDGALSAVNLLKKELQDKFSSNSFWGLGPKNVSFQLVDSLQKSLNGLQKNQGELTLIIEQDDSFLKKI